MPIRRVFFFQMAVDGRECHGATLMDRLEAPDGKLSDDKASSQVDNWPTSCQSSSLSEKSRRLQRAMTQKKKKNKAILATGRYFKPKSARFCCHKRNNQKTFWVRSFWLLRRDHSGGGGAAKPEKWQVSRAIKILHLRVFGVLRLSLNAQKKKNSPTPSIKKKKCKMSRRDHKIRNRYGQFYFVHLQPTGIFLFLGELLSRRNCV